MKYALINDELQEARPGLSGKCNLCGHPAISKCGDVKIWHWAHSGRRMCDPWWEKETEWHRAWKGQFPKEYQEIIHFAENGEKHIADVKIDQGYVIEFQHSRIEPEEQQAREYFYKKMTWIVDGKRRSRDKDKFSEIWDQSKSLDSKENVRRVCDIFFDECALLRDWMGSNVPVFFDFGEDRLFGLLPKTMEGRYIFRLERDGLISFLHPAPNMISFEVLLKELNKLLIAKEALSSFQQNFQHLKANHAHHRSQRRRF